MKININDSQTYESDTLFCTKILDNMAEGVILVRMSDGIIIYINSRFDEMFGYEKGELLHKHVNTIDAGGSDGGKGAAVFKKILEQGFANNVILRHKRKDGSTFYGETNASLLSDPKGNPYGVIVTTRDITKRINDEKELLKAKEKAIESDRLKSAFLANMSHEIRTPMNGIVGFADLVKNRNISSGKRNKYLDIILDRSKHLLNIINDIIDISKIEAGEINIIKKEFNLNKMLRKLYSFFESEIQIKDFRDVELSLKSGLEDNDSIIYTDPIRLQQILTNLISNAFKFTNKGFIEYGYTITDKETLNFYVKDTGIGLSRKEQNIIFDRFRQGENRDNELTHGTGLGLSISKGLIEFLGGKIWVKSKKGSGSTFYFDIPYKTTDKSKQKKAGKKGKIYNNHILEGKTILIVEDDDTSFYFFKEIFNVTDVKLLWVKEGSEAIKLCRENPDIDLVLMDIKLPKMNGYEATQSIKKFRKDLPVIAETAYALAGEKDKAVNAGCDDYLSKPVDKDVLMKKIRRLLKRQQLL
jgi:PAS domain S-box-containing protein